MGITTLLVCLLPDSRQPAWPASVFKTLALGLTMLTLSMVTGCGSGGEGDPGPMITDSTTPVNEGSNGGGTGTGSGSGDSSSPTPGGASAFLSWDPVGDPSVLGYIVHYGKSSSGMFGSCSYERATFSSSPSATITGLAPNTTYFFAVSAFNGLESACSAEVATVTSSAI